MFKHILVPLDGSELAEAAVPPAVILSRKLGAEVTLIHVIEKNAPQEIHGQRHLTSEIDALKYLEQTAARFSGVKISVDTHVHTEEVSQVARSIVEHSREFDPDLIILSAHGEGGLHDFVIGSIPQQVIAGGSIPVLLLQPEIGHDFDHIKYEHILVALDGNPIHDQCLEIARDLAEGVHASLHLIQVVPTLFTLPGEESASGTLLPGSTNAMLDMAEEEACEYLQEKVGELYDRGLTAAGEVGRGEPAVEVVNSAEREKVDLIVLGTHGKKGMGALWASSVAPQIVSRTRLPVLLVPVSD